jgi:hypothetical protein
LYCSFGDRSQANFSCGELEFFERVILV